MDINTVKLATHHERETFVADLIRHAPKATIWTATRLLRLGHTYGRLIRAEDYKPLKLYRIERKLEAICLAAGCKLVSKPLSDHTVWVRLGNGVMLPIPTS